MKTSIYIIFLFFTITISSQTNWTEIESQLWKQKENGDISLSEWYLNLKMEAGSITRDLSPWYKKNELIEPNDSDNEIKLFFPKDYQIEKENGNKYAKLYIDNNSKDTINVKTTSSLIRGITEYYMIDNSWIKGRNSNNVFLICGNGYDLKIAPENRAYILIGNEPLTSGDNKIKYKLILEIDDKEIESNTIEVSLFENQIKRLKETE
tara:strand:+ start:435 stop:1058 length:624 start_codon:yes stop_codon:yes gene_type:complete